MRSLVPTSAGFVANILRRDGRRSRGHGRRGVILVALTAVIVLVATQSTRFLLDARTEADDQETTSVIAKNSYEFKIYALNQSLAMHQGVSSRFYFNVDDLPIDIAAIDLGDFRKDSTFKDTYYGCSGILINASGSNAEITLRESTGKFISAVEYHGQNPVVFGSMAWSTSGSTTKTFDGTDILVLDWRAGEWTPAQGIVVEHPGNISLTKAKFFVMVFTPGYGQEIPEFDLLYASALMISVILFVRRRVVGALDKKRAP